MSSKILQGEFGAQARRRKNAKSSLCANGHHRWRTVDSTPFDVKKGELVTRERCQRCGKVRVLPR